MVSPAAAWPRGRQHGAGNGAFFCASVHVTRHITEILMPIVTIQVTREGSAPGRDAVTAEEKARLIKGVSEVLLNVLNKPMEATFVVIEEVDKENWGWGGLPVDEYRALKKAKSA
jgi:4-oxalocrotonate tautomerase